MRDLSIVLPTYNEAENLPSIVKKIDNALGGKFSYEIIVVDDNSPDGTAKVANSLSKKYPLKIIVRPRKLGLAKAILAGFLSSKSNILAVMDADCQHPPSALPKMVKLVKNNYDLVIGSRYTDGASIHKNWSRRRRMESRLATFGAMFLTPGVTDPMSGFFVVKRSVIESIDKWDLHGYKILLEILAKGDIKKVAEVPICFHHRKFGKSKLDRKEILNYGLLLAHLYWWKIKRSLL